MERGSSILWMKFFNSLISKINFIFVGITVCIIYYLFVLLLFVSVETVHF